MILVFLFVNGGEKGMFLCVFFICDWEDDFFFKFFGCFDCLLLFVLLLFYVEREVFISGNDVWVCDLIRWVRVVLWIFLGIVL